mgnify:CR=1 FL=1
MTISVDWTNKLVMSTASILDLPAFKDSIRDLEDDAIGMQYPGVISYKRVDIGGGAYFHAVDLINGYQLKFTGSGPFRVVGNLSGTIVDTGVQIERETSAAFSTTAVGGSGPSAGQIADEVMSRIAASFVPADVKRVNGVTIVGTGVSGNEWGPA